MLLQKFIVTIKADITPLNNTFSTQCLYILLYHMMHSPIINQHYQNFAEKPVAHNLLHDVSSDLQFIIF